MFSVWSAYSKFKDSNTRKDDDGDENGVDDYV
jgi:cation transport regulator ChaB